LLEAMRLAPDLDVGLDIYGEASDADYDRRLRSLATSDRRVRFAGTFASDAFAGVVHAADLLVVPSIWYENSPLVLLQALALRCPVLVADVPGLAPHIRGLQDGWTFERANAKDLAQKLRAIANDASAREAIRRTTHESRTMASYVADIEAEYAKCALQGPAR
jgi:glycosyltransferase involved in cell wall biosynthesis